MFVKEVSLLCKTLLPLPDKHAGLVDKELRYRKRWLDLICQPEVCQRFRARSRIIRILRDMLGEEDFMEVETPVLQSIYGGAEARPVLGFGIAGGTLRHCNSLPQVAGIAHSVGARWSHR